MTSTVSLQPHAFDGVVDAPGPGGLWEDAPKLSALLDKKHAHRYFNDFLGGQDPASTDSEFARVTDAIGVTAFSAVAGGWLVIAVTNTDNNETYFLGRTPLLDADAGNAWFECKLSHTASSTAGKGSWVIGLSDTGAANTITDAGALVSSFDGCVFFKGEDDTHVTFVTSNATTNDSDNVVAWSEGNTPVLGFKYCSDGVGKAGTAASGFARVEFYYNNTYVGYQDINKTSLADMKLIMGVKTHEAQIQTIAVDYVDFVQLKSN